MYLGESFESIAVEHEIDLINYDEAMSDVDAHLWKKTMKAKLESMYSNQVWELVEAPEEIKTSGCKWFNKKKRRVNGKIKPFKARLVAEGYVRNLVSTMKRLSHRNPCSSP